MANRNHNLTSHEDFCDTCYDFQRCSGEKCEAHPWYDGELLDLVRAMRSGIPWGDYMYDMEQLERAKETKPQREARLKKEAELERQGYDRLKEQALNNDRVKHCVKIKGKYVLKHKYPVTCNKLLLPNQELADGSKYPGGCWAHKEGICPYIHPDEEGKFDFKGKRKIVLQKNSNNNSATRTWKRGGKRNTRSNKNRK